MSRREVYVSTDVEADGRIPGPHSMLSFASVAFSEEGTELGSFSRNLQELEGASGHPETMAWWQTQPEAWAACRKDTVPPADAMKDYVAWLDALDGKPVFVGYPAAYDFLFVYWYLIKFCGRSPFSHSALDIKSYAMAVMKTRFHDSSKRSMPRRWFPEVNHSHVALDDAREQGLLFCAILKERRASS